MALMFLSWLFVLLAVYSAARGINDLRAKRYLWAGAGLTLTALSLGAFFIPIQTHAVKIDLPVR